MPKRGANISLSSYDDIFETDESRADAQPERVQKISISELVPFKDHPFKVVEDEAMLRTTESIAQYGVLTPLIARPLEDGTYEIISGHRRVHAAQAAGLTEVPVIVRDMDDDAATVLMVDSNLQREHILPSERAFAYKMKLEAIKHQGFLLLRYALQLWALDCFMVLSFMRSIFPMRKADFMSQKKPFEQIEIITRAPVSTHRMERRFSYI